MYRLVVFLFLTFCYLPAFAQLPNLPVWSDQLAQKPPADWLIKPIAAKAGVYRSADKRDVILWNGLLKRSFRIQPNVACFDFVNLNSGEQLLRAVKPEARLTLNGKTYHVGGLYGQSQNAYLQPDWLDSFRNNPADFSFQTLEVHELPAYVRWKAQLWAGNPSLPTGKQVSFVYRSSEWAGLTVRVNYDLYDGLPLISKSVTIENNGATEVTVDGVVNEILAVTEEESAVVGSVEQMKKPHGLYIESNYAFNNAMKAELSDQTTHWLVDSTYHTQVNYNYQTPCLLEVYPPIGPGQVLEKGQTFRSIRTYELLLDSYDRERNGLARRRMYRTIAPWTTQNPIFMHLISTDPVKVRSIIDQCAETGYEGVILSFGSGLNMEDTSAANLQKFKELADYAHRKGILLGGYSLFSSRKISPEDDVIDPKTGKPDVHAQFGNAPCMGSRWGLAYLKKIKTFLKTTGFDIFENDGPYPGDVCASTTHPGHHGLADSQWAQLELQKELYRWCNETGIYVNAPDWYFLDGSHKIAMGYRETNFSLPREQQLIMSRQHVYDGTWEKTPSMGWMFVPLSEYHGGGAAATIEPLREHLDMYEKLMVQNYGSGVQACYRGPRLYDSDKTREVVRKTVSWYKQYRDILNSDLIHLRRPDGRDWDGILHVNPNLKQKGFLLVHNPTNQPLTRTISVPLYYTGLTKSATVRQADGTTRTYALNRDFSIDLPVTIGANGYFWVIIGL